MSEKVNKKVEELVEAVKEVEKKASNRPPKLVELNHPDKQATLYYTLDGTYPIPNKSAIYMGPFYVQKDTVVKCVALVGSDVSPVATKHVKL